MIHYYARFSGLTGDTPNGQWFAVLDANFGSSSSTTITSAGAGAGKVSFQDLALVLPSNSSLTTSLDRYLEAGTPLLSIELVGFDESGPVPVKVSGFKVTTAFVSSDSTELGAGYHRYTFNFGTVEESTAKFDTAGNVSGALGSTWDILRNLTNGGSSLALPKLTDPYYGGVSTGTIDPVNTGARHMYIQFRNLDGTALSGLGANWIEIDAASTGQIQTRKAGDFTAGVVKFSGLSFHIEPGSLGPVLDQALLTGKGMQVELAVYGENAAGSVLVDDYQFGLAALSQITTSNGSQYYSLNFGSERIAHSVYDSNGLFVRTDVAGWNIVTNLAQTTPNGTSGSFDTQHAPAQETGITVLAMPHHATQYYVRFSASANGVIKGETANAQWFAVSSTNYGIGQLLNIGPGATGTGASKVTFSDLHLELGASNLTQQLVKYLDAGNTFASIELVGFDESGAAPVKVSSAVFKVAHVTGDSTNIATGSHLLSFSYGTLIESEATFDASGTAGTPVTAGWNLTSNIADNSTANDARERATDPYFGGASTGIVAGSSTLPHKTYVQFRDASGKPIAGLGTDWIAVDSASVGASSSSSNGATSFGPLSLSFKPGVLGPALDLAMAGGKLFRVELAVYGTINGKDVLLDTYQYGVAGLIQHDFTGSELQRYTLNYSAKAVVHNVYDASGALVGSNLEDWNLKTNAAGASLGSRNAPASEASITEHAEAHHVTQYYARFTDGTGSVLTGDTTASQWFAVPDPSFGGSQTVNLLTAPTSVGKEAFYNLSLTLGKSALAVKLGQLLEKGTLLNSIELVGYDESGAVPVKVSSNVFKMAGVAGDSFSQSEAGGSHTFSFTYDTLIESRATFDAAGAVSGAVTGGWNRATNTEDSSTAFDAQERAGDPFVNGSPTGAVGPDSSGGQRIYIQFRGSNGLPISELGTKWLQVQSASFQHGQSFSAPLSGAGSVSFGDLRFTLDPGALGPVLDLMLAKGMFGQVEVAIYGTKNGSNVLLDDYQFGLSYVSSHSVGGGFQTYSVGYGSERSAHNIYDANGAYLRTEVAGWDRVAKTVLTSPSGTSSSFDLQKAPASEHDIAVFLTPLNHNVPTITAEVVTPLGATLHAGATVSFTLTASQAVTAAGTFLLLSNGAKAVLDTAGSTDTVLIYNYLVTKSDAATNDLKAAALVGSITSKLGVPYNPISFDPIDSQIIIDPNNPTTISGATAGTVTLGGALAASGKLTAVDADAGEAALQPFSSTGKFGTFSIDASGNWAYSLVSGPAATFAKATGLPLSETFHVLSADGSASADIAVSVVVPDNPGPLTFTGTSAADTLYGAGDSDVLSGLGANDALYGLGGADTLNGGTGADTMVGGNGDDTYTVDTVGDVVDESATDGIDRVYASVSYTLGANVENLTLTGSDNLNGTGNALANVLVGNSGNNTLTGGEGSDWLDGRAGADTLVGGNGNDSYVVDNLGDVVDESVTNGIDRVYASISYTLGTNVENLTLTGSANLNGTGNALTNMLVGNSGSNTLAGGEGNDSLDGGLGADTLIGGNGDDTYTVDNVGDSVDESTTTGIDKVNASISYTLGANVENLTLTGSANLNGTGNALANVLVGNSGNNTLAGGEGNDTLDGGFGADTLIGGNGDDTYTVDNVGDVVDESTTTGVDKVNASISYTLGANVENLTLTGSANLDGTGNALANVLNGTSGNNTLTGGEGSDWLDGRAGADALVGGNGNDTYVVDNVGDVVDESVTDGIDKVNASISYTLGTNVENLTLTGSANLNGTGNALANALVGNSGNNILTGGEGNDSLDGGLGADTLIGGNGDDTYTVDNVGDVVDESVTNGIDKVNASISYALGTNVENLTLTGSANLDGTGNALANMLVGNSGTNSLTGGEGNDTLDGGLGADTLIGGNGDDTYVVDNLGDSVDESTTTGIDKVNASISYTLGANVENLTLTGATNLNGTGNALANVMNGNSGNNTLAGGEGNDWLDGRAGADTLVGGNGNDSYVVDNVGDSVDESVSNGIDKVYASINYTLGANVENLTLTGTDNLSGTGNALANVLVGNSGNNLLAGMDGNDTLSGGAGADIFAFNTAPKAATNLDTVQDFTSGSDVLAFSMATFTAFAALGAISSDAFWSGAGVNTAHDPTDRFIYNTTTGALWYDADGTGSGAAVQVAILTTHPAVAYTDFQIIA